MDGSASFTRTGERVGRAWARGRRSRGSSSRRTRCRRARICARLLSACALLAIATSVTDARAQDDELGFDPHELLELDIEALMELRVAAPSRREQPVADAPGVVSIISRAEIEAYGANDLVEVLSRALNFYVRPKFNFPRSEFVARGDGVFYANHVLFLLNGRPVRSAFNGARRGIVTRGIPVSAVDRIEIVRGPGSVLYGSTAYSAVVDIILRSAEPNDTEATARLAAGSNRDLIADGYVGYASERGSVRAGVYARDDRGWTLSARDVAGVLGSDRERQQTLSVYLGAELGDLSVELLYSHQEFPSRAGVLLWPRYQSRHDQLWLDVGYERDVHERVRLSAHVTVDAGTGLGYDPMPPTLPQPPLPSRIESSLQDVDILGELVVNVEIRDDLHLVAGATVENLRGQWLYSAEGHRNLPEDDPGRLVLGDIPAFSQLWFSQFLQIDYRPIEQLMLVAGVQLNEPEGVTLDVAPRLGLIVHPTESSGIKALWGRAFRNPYPTETALTSPALLPNPDLEPEHIDTIDLEYFYDSERFRVSIAGFYSRMDLIGALPVDPSMPDLARFVNQYKNDKRQILGVEVELRAEPIRGLRLYCGFTHNEILSDVNLGRDVIPSSSLRLGASYRHARGISLSAFYTLNGAPPTADLWEAIRDDPSNELNDRARANGIPNRRANLLTLHGTLNLSRLVQWSGWQEWPEVVLGVYGVNVLSSQTVNDHGSFFLYDERGPASIVGELELRY